MSLVEAFYQRLAQDEVFRAKVQSVKSKEECSQIVQGAGYHFTQEEFEAYNSKLLELDPAQVQDLDEQEMAEVLGGLQNLVLPAYGGPFPPELPYPFPRENPFPFPEPPSRPPFPVLPID